MEKVLGDRKKPFVEKMGTVNINLEDYEKAGTNIDVLRMVIKRIEDLPPLPLVVHKIISLTQDADSSTTDLAKAIAYEQTLTARLLRIVNSPFYHLSSQVTAVSHAVILLGFREVRNLALGLATMEAFGEPQGNHAFSRQKFWEHSLACALCCKAIAKQARHRLHEEAFVGGLLHDIGRMVFDQFFTGSFDDVLKTASLTGRPLVDLEREIMGIPHTLVGKLLLQKWNLPSSLAEAIQYHHHLLLQTGGEDPWVGIPIIICIADILTKIGCIGSSGENHVYPIEQTIWSNVPLQEMDYVRILSELAKEIDEIKGFFGIKSGAAHPAYQKIAGGSGPSQKVALFSENSSVSVHPIRLVLQQFFHVESHPLNGDMKAIVSRLQPLLMFVDLSSEQSPEKSLDAMKFYRSGFAGPLVFLLAKKVSKDAQQKSAKVGIFLISSPFCPQELLDCLSQVNLPTS